MLIGGGAQVNRDSVHAITSRLPLVLALIGVITFVLLFLLTGSLVLPLKALVLNMLSLSAAFGALVWIFQEGHLNAFGTTPTGTLEANMPVLLFCIAFGLSMDYEVFLVSRIREYWLESAQTARRQRRERGARTGPHRSGRHRGRVDHGDRVRSADRRTGVVHADLRTGADAGRSGRRDAWCGWRCFRRSCTSWAGGTGGPPNRWSACTHRVGFSEEPPEPARDPVGV